MGKKKELAPLRLVDLLLLLYDPSLSVGNPIKTKATKRHDNPHTSPPPKKKNTKRVSHENLPPFPKGKIKTTKRVSHENLPPFPKKKTICEKKECKTPGRRATRASVASRWRCHWQRRTPLREKIAGTKKWGGCLFLGAPQKLWLCRWFPFKPRQKVSPLKHVFQWGTLQIGGPLSNLSNRPTTIIKLGCPFSDPPLKVTNF